MRRLCLRLKKYNEHINDHQLQLAQAVTTEGPIVPAYETEDLPHAVAEARKQGGQPGSLTLPPMLGLVEKAIEELMS